MPDCLVTGYGHLIETVQLPDENDCHIVAAAIAAKADVIITFNLTDFPSRPLARHGLEALHPDEFLNQQVDANEAAVLAAARGCRVRLRRPPMTVGDYLAVLERQGLRTTARRLRSREAAL